MTDETKKQVLTGSEPSGVKDDRASQDGPGNVKVASKTPENRPGHLNPSSPEDANTTPGSVPEK